MSTLPLISVVMSVYNGAENLPETLESILTQEGVDLEFIVINDGSTDDSLQLLDKYAVKDNRLKVLNQENQGLTRSLIRGCAEAKGEFIARQDVGDISLPGRLKKQLDLINLHSEVSFVTCGSRFVDQNNLAIYEVIQTQKELEEGLAATEIKTLRGVSSHPSVMFRRDVYRRVGGYRKEFYVAQDIDLWIRLAEAGRPLSMQEILVLILMSLRSISSTERDRQIVTAELILECAQRRRSGQSEETILEQASKIQSHLAGAGCSRMRDSGFYYFLGCCLRNSDPEKAKNYFTLALKSNPLHLKALFRYLNTR